MAKVVVDGVKTDPPCIGGLRCNPARGANGIIPAHKIGVLEKVAKENRQRAADPDFAYACSYLEEAASEAEAVVQFFQNQKPRNSKEED